MADIELVVKIPEEIRLALISNIQLSLDQQSIYDSCVKQAIINGTLLPKGHGRLIDEKEISLSGIHFQTELDHARMIGKLNTALTIIEADKESERSK